MQWKQFQRRRATKDELSTWLSQYQPQSWAVVCGTVSGLCVIDFDGEAGRATCEKLGLRPHVRTGSGGYHLYVESPSWATHTVNGKSKQRLGGKFPGLDFRGDGGYAIFDGTNTSGRYGWLRPMKADPINILPADLLQALGLSYPPEKQPVADSTEDPPHEEGTREDSSRVDSAVLIRRALDQVSACGRKEAGFWLAQQLRDNGYTRGEAEAAMLEYQRRVPPTNSKGEPEPYNKHEVLSSVEQAYSHTPRNPWPTQQDFRLTDQGNADLLATWHGDDLRYCHIWNKWLLWDGTRFKVDTSGAIYRRALGAIRTLQRRALKLDDDNKRQATAKWALRSESRAKLDAMVNLTQHHQTVVVQPDKFDSDPWALCVKNGVFDLRAGKLLPHSRGRLITKLAPVNYDPEATAPIFHNFLGRIMKGNQQLIEYLQAGQDIA